VAVLLNATAGFDARDPDSALNQHADYVAALAGTADDLVLGVLPALIEGVEDEIRLAFQRALAVFESAGVTVRALDSTVDWPAVLTAHRLIVAAEASHALRPYWQERADLLSPILQQRLEDGQQVTALAYLEARDCRERLIRQMSRIFEAVDLLLMPTVACEATPRERPTLAATPPEANVSFLMTRTAPFNMTGQPALTLPCGFATSGLPLGLEVIGPRSHDAQVLRIGHLYQACTDWHRRRPALDAGAEGEGPARDAASLPRRRPG
jgi:aspartyl-tRNA(Asn)/glutamyl-tRNA(Gln) amidotransferase subunit A